MNAVAATRISFFPTLSLERYLDFNTTNVENPLLHKYCVTNSIYVREALLTTSGYSSLMLFQNPKSDHEENFIRSKESDVTPIELFFLCPVMKFDT